MFEFRSRLHEFWLFCNILRIFTIFSICFLDSASVSVIETMAALTVASKLYHIKVIIDFQNLMSLFDSNFGHYLDQFLLLFNLVTEKNCRAHTSINISDWIKCCSPTSCILVASSEGSSFRLVMYFSSGVISSRIPEKYFNFSNGTNMQAFAEWILFTASGIASGIYHACDVGTWCALNFGVLQVTHLYSSVFLSYSIVKFIFLYFLDIYIYFTLSTFQFMDFWLSFMAVISTFVYLATIDEVHKRAIHTAVSIFTALISVTNATR